jgi:hypothetical protein
LNTHRQRGWAEWLMFSCGVWHVGLGLYFIFLRPALLSEDLRYMGVDAGALSTVVLAWRTGWARYLR